MTVTINGTSGVTTPEVTLDNTAADGGQVVLKSSGYSNWNLDNYSGRLRAYYGSTEYFTINSSGNVGIGTSSPSARLHVKSSNGVVVNESTGDVTSSGTSYLGLNDVNGQAAYIGYGGDGSGVMSLWNRKNGATIFATNNTERARIDSSGNLLVGTTSTGFSNSRSFAFQGLGDGKVYVNHSTANTSGDGFIGFGYNGNQIGSITQNGTTATAYNTSSDYRLKENIAPMTGALSVVQQLKPCTYTWKADGSDGQGFIAHELAEVLPDCVTGEKDAVDADGNPEYQGIDSSFLVATLTAAIQEQQAIIESLKTRIEILENK